MTSRHVPITKGSRDKAFNCWGARLHGSQREWNNPGSNTDPGGTGLQESG